jgi:hypothetical protein
MRQSCRIALVAALSSLVLPGAAAAQAAAEPPAPAGRTTLPGGAVQAQPPLTATATMRGPTCDMRLRMIPLAVRDARGRPVTGARLALRDARTKQPVAAEPREDGRGRYTLLDDAALGLLPTTAGGTRALELVVTRGAMRRVVPLTLGRTADGCHAALVEGPSVVTLR